MDNQETLRTLGTPQSRKTKQMSNTDPTKHGCEEEFEDNQRGNQNPYIEEEQIAQWPKGQTTIYKTYT